MNRNFFFSQDPFFCLQLLKYIYANFVSFMHVCRSFIFNLIFFHEEILTQTQTVNYFSRKRIYIMASYTKDDHQITGSKGWLPLNE